MAADESEAKRLLADCAERLTKDDPAVIEELRSAATALLRDLKNLNGAAGVAVVDHPNKQQGWIMIRFPKNKTVGVFAGEHGEVFVVGGSLQQGPRQVELQYNHLTKRLEGKDNDSFQPTPPERYPLKRSALAQVVEAAIAVLP